MEWPPVRLPRPRRSSRPDRVRYPGFLALAVYFCLVALAVFTLGGWVAS